MDEDVRMDDLVKFLGPQHCPSHQQQPGSIHHLLLNCVAQLLQHAHHNWLSWLFFRNALLDKSTMCVAISGKANNNY